MNTRLKVSELLDALLTAFPRADAEDWDHVGLSVGDPDASVKRVYIALDATEAMVHEARKRGADVLLAHHPVYISAPDSFVPRADNQPQAAAAVYHAARCGVSIISLHTNLDRSRAARELLPSLLGLEAVSSLEYPNDPGRTGLGAYADTEPLTLSQLARTAAAAFHTSPRVWGDPDARITRCAFLGGSLGSLGEQAHACGAQAIITGEAGYHVCQDMAAHGISVILLGHDASEYPFTRILAHAARDAGVAEDDMLICDPPRQWWTQPEGACA